MSLESVADHLWQSTLFALVAWLLTFVLRKNRARVRYWIWFAAALKLLIPFSLLISLGSEFQWRTVPESAAPLVVVVVQASQPFTVPAPSIPAAAPAHEFPVAKILLGVWAFGFIGFACAWFVRWIRIHNAVRSGVPVELDIPISAISSPSLLEPGVFGILRPVLLLPEGIHNCLSPEQLRAIIVHELCHVRNYDNFTAAIQMVAETVFWFHPLVWWIGKRMIAERERACDEEVLRVMNEPRVYAEGILNVCKLYTESPLACVSGISGSDLRRRIETIMRNQIALRLTFVRKLALGIAGIAALVFPTVLGVIKAPALFAQSTTGKWEVVSIRQGCPGGETSQGPPPGWLDRPIQGRLSFCAIAQNLVAMAYTHYANPPTPVVGMPAWTRSDKYMLNAKAEGTPGQEVMRGPMLQSLLEDRFKLKLHRETRQEPVYELSVAKGGPKLPRFKEGSCIPVDFSKVWLGPITLSEKSCRDSRKQVGPNQVFDSHGITLDQFVNHTLVGAVDRPILDKTGLTGLYDVRLTYAPDPASPMARANPAPDEPAGGTSIFTAVQEQLGLKLVPAKGPREYLVVDRIERPSEN